jgi:hypothetical protein
MAASKANYLIVYKSSAQVYSATNLETAQKTPLPKGCKKEDKQILFLSFLPDEGSLYVHVLDEQPTEESDEQEQESIKD